MKLTKLSTADLHGYSVKFSSDVSTDYLACVASTNYGLGGRGELLVFQNLGDGYFPVQRCMWNDAIFDVAWKPFSSEVIATGSGDGNIQIWAFKHQKEPCLVIKGHSREVSSVEWAKLTDDPVLLSTSWDEAIRMWDVMSGKELRTFLGHHGVVNAASWSPHKPGVFASVGVDKSICVWDMRSPNVLPQQIDAGVPEVTSIDWSILHENIIATADVDSLIKGWDLRQPNMPMFQLAGHEMTLRRVKFSPFHPHLLASVSYDFSTRFWDWMSTAVDVCSQHTEFVYGLDFSQNIPGKVADCSWDNFIHIYDDVNISHKL